MGMGTFVAVSGFLGFTGCLTTILLAVAGLVYMYDKARPVRSETFDEIHERIGGNLPT